jgi:hypothetical protein
MIFMSPETTLSNITARLRQGRFQNTQAVSQDIVLNILKMTAIKLVAEVACLEVDNDLIVEF